MPDYKSEETIEPAIEIFTIEGNVVDENGLPLPGVNVIERGTANGTVTDLNGYFSVFTTIGSTLRISFVGYATQEILISKKEYILVLLQLADIKIDNIVVTALGLKKAESSLAYSVKEIKGDELNKVKDPHLMNTLTGKVSGLQINKTSSGLGASSRVLMRGMRSVIGNNQPLYVIDGIPVLNSSNEQARTAIGGTADAGNRDGGDGISNLNPEDIESISVLKGTPASALYGSQAANGVILITTKRGLSDIHKVMFATSLTFDNAFALPEMQNTYGSNDGVNSWGAKQNMPEHDNLGGFYKTGVTSITSLSVNTGNKLYQTYFSYGNTVATGIIENNKMLKHNINLHETASLYDNRLKLDGNINLFRQQLDNRTSSGGFYMNPLVGLYRFPRGADITPYKEGFEVFDKVRNLHVQNWHSDIQDFEQNPYWVVNRITSKDTRNRIIASASAELQLSNQIKLQARGSVDNIEDKIRQQFYASTAPALAGRNGRYVEMYYSEIMYYGDVMAMYNHKWGAFSVNAALGASINDKTVNTLRYDSKTASLKYPNVFNIANINMNGAAYISQQIDARRQTQSVFGTAQLGYGKQVYLDITARNDWASTLAFTPHENTGFFYPSFGSSWIIHETVRMPSWVSFGKLRAVWSKAGNDIPLFITNPVAHVTAGGEIEDIDAAPFKELEPEMTTSVELGTEWKLLDNRINISVTWYQTNTRNQFFKLPAQSGDKYAYRYANAGDIRNRGLEVSLSGYPAMSNHNYWRTEINFSRNVNKAIKLHDELPVFLYGPQSFSSSYAMKLREGGQFGDIYGKAFRRDGQGHIVYETNGEKAGLPAVDGDGNLIKVGNINPAFRLSWINEFKYKDWTLSFLIDSRYKGEVLSQTMADLDMFGVTKATAEARDAGYVMLEGRRIDNVEGFYRTIAGGRAGVTEYYMYDATNIRLREFSLGWSVSGKWIANLKALQNISLSLVGRNLFFIYKKAPFDPELVLSTGNDNQGIEVYGMPTDRSLGFNIKCEF